MKIFPDDQNYVGDYDDFEASVIGAIGSHSPTEPGRKLDAFRVPVRPQSGEGKGLPGKYHCA